MADQRTPEQLAYANRFQDLYDFDVDGAVVVVGVQHTAFGSKSPALQVRTGAVTVTIELTREVLDELSEAIADAELLAVIDGARV
ncbi:MAG TPA: hypothetical protein VEA44_16075 [Caulobacter sp.]|nr:hypothetical protein [Caulobacter sp.]